MEQYLHSLIGHDLVLNLAQGQLVRAQELGIHQNPSTIERAVNTRKS